MLFLHSASFYNLSQFESRFPQETTHAQCFPPPRGFFSRANAVRRRLCAGCRALRAPLPLADRARRGAGGVRHQLGSQFAVGRRKAQLAGRTARGGYSCCPVDARHGRLRAAGCHRPDSPRRGGGLRRRVDAAAVLLQGRQRRWPVPCLCPGDRGGGRCAFAGLPVSHPRREPGAARPGLGRPPVERLSRHHRRREGQLG